MLKSLLDINGKIVQIFNIHGLINYSKTGNKHTEEQCRFIIDNALKTDLPTIIVVDFNLNPNSKNIELMNEHFSNLSVEYGIKNTRSEEKEAMVIDYIFVNKGIKVEDFNVISTNISDHFPFRAYYD